MDEIKEILADVDAQEYRNRFRIDQSEIETVASSSSNMDFVRIAEDFGQVPDAAETETRCLYYAVAPIAAAGIVAWLSLIGWLIMFRIGICRLG